MKLVMTLLVRNEADIVGTNIEYHLAQGVDFVLVTDHGSEDGTRDVLREYERMGVAKVIDDDRPGHHQSERVTRMVEIARRRHDADWVINNDADEFWWPLAGDLRDVFASLPPRYGQIEVRRRNFRPQPDNDEEAPFYARLIHREASSSTVGGEALELKVAHRPVPGVVIAPGNHSIRGVQLAVAPVGEALEIFHFPMRSYDQFERKVIQTGLGYEQIPDRSPMVGCDQIALLELHRAGKLGEYYDSLVVHGDALERGLEMGTLVVDRRLESFMDALQSNGHPRTRPEAPFARTLLRRVMDALAELEQKQEELQSLRTQNDSASSRVAQLEAQVSELSTRLDHETLKLQEATDEMHNALRTLEVVQNSRLMRSTAWVRRLYYRARPTRPTY